MWSDKCSDVYDPGGEAGLLWNDPGLRIEWPVKEPLLWPKDSRNPVLALSRADLPATPGPHAIPAIETVLQRSPVPHFGGVERTGAAPSTKY